MKSAVLARPNLKLFLVGALLVAVVESIVTNGHSGGPMVANARSASGSVQDDIGALLQQAEKKPTAEVYVRISNAYEQRRDFKRALFFYREADRLAESEEQ